MSNELITIERKEVATIIKAFDAPTRKAIDEAIALGNEFGRAHNDEAKRLNVARSIAVFKIAEDKEAVEKAGFETFKELATALFGLAPANATQYRKSAERFYCNPDCNSPVKDWFGPSTLYLFASAKVEDKDIEKGIKDGKLSDKSTNEQIKAWIASLKPEELTDGKPEVVKLYDVHYTKLDMAGGKCEASQFNEYAVTLNEIKSAMREAGTPDGDDYYTYFNPHATLTRVNKKGESKKVTGKGLLYHSLTVICVATYFPAEVKKTPKNSPQDAVQMLKNMTAEQRAQILKMLSGGAYDPEEDDE